VSTSTAYNKVELAKLSASSTNSNRRFFLDKIATKIVTLGGLVILLSICTIILVILTETLPLFDSLKLTNSIVTQVNKEGNQKISFIVSDNHLQQALSINSDFSIKNININENKVNIINEVPSELKNTKITSFYKQDEIIFLGTTNGELVSLQTKYHDEFNNNKRTSKAFIKYGNIESIAPNHIIKFVTGAKTSLGQVWIAYVNDALKIVYRKESSGLFKNLPATTTTLDYKPNIKGQVTGLTIDSRGENIVIATDRAEIVILNLKSGNQINQEEIYNLKELENYSAITDLKFVQGDRTVIIADRDGRLSSWQILKNNLNKIEFIKIYDFASHNKPILGISIADRNRVFVTYDESNHVKVHYSTSGSTLADFKLDLSGTLERLVLSPKGDAILALDNQANLTQYKLYNPHPEISWRTLFSPIQYEGYKEKEYVWQSTGGTDKFEPKFGLMPLIFGTLKGALYALIFALPLAFLSAVYTALFMPRRLKAVVKPVIETMAAMPSVVIGFVAGLWLAPILEPHLLSILLLPFILVFSVTLGCLLAWYVQNIFQKKFRLGFELMVTTISILVSFYLTYVLSLSLEELLFVGNFKAWAYEVLNINIDQRNSIIAGIAVGFAVIPIIYTISEDCLTSVPRALSAGALALGATRWQTALKVVVPVAAPGIFAAIMIGIGRAVGETMIVLMATGNTPIMDLSAFSGFRALSANIAVELPEAPVGSTLYRILFLTALILFILTFSLNAISELVRSKLKRKLSGGH
jgi:phosphate transport system permease protein